MAITVHLASYLRPFAGERGEIVIEKAGNVRDLLAQLPAGVRDRVLDGAGAVRQHVNVFVNQTHAKDLGGLEAKLVAGDHVHLLPAVSGG